MTRSLVLTLSVGLVAAGGGATSGAQQAREPNEHGAPHGENTFVKIPAAMALEHEAIHEQLAAAIAAGGRTGAAARNVEAQLAPHFARARPRACPAQWRPS
jgi:hypothetical protein